MPHASDLHGKYIPHNTNKIPGDDQYFHVNNDTSLLNESVRSGSAASPQKIETNINEVPQISTSKSTTVTASQGFWTTKKIVIVVIIVCVLLAIGGGVAAAVILTQKKDSTNTTSTTISSTSGTTQTTTTATTATTTTATTTPSNPCASGSLRWNTTGITVLNSSQLTNVHGLYLTSNNTLYAVDEYGNSVVWRLLNGATSATNVAGIAQSRGSASTQLNYPQDVYFDSNGNLYVTDYYNYRVQKYANGSTNGTTVAGITGSPGWGLSQFNGLRGITFDAAETYMYISDCDSHRIMRYPTNSTTGTSGTLVAGTGGAGNTNTTLYYPWGIHYLPSVSSDLYIANYYGHSVIRWTPGASIGSFVAGVPGVSGQTPILLNNPTGVRIDTYLNVYVADMSNHRIQMFCPNTQAGITVAGTGIAGNSATQLNQPRSIVFDSSMNMYVADSSNYRIQKFMRL